MRVGWFVFSEELARELEDVANSTYITPALLGEAAVFEFVRRGNFEPNLVRVNGLLKARRDAMMAALERHLPAGALVEARRAATSPGSSFPRASDAAELARRAEGVTVVLGTDFGGPPNTVRLAYSFVSPDEIDVGVERLAAALATF